MNDEITHEEIIELFGGEMPMEAVDILFNGPAGMTVAEAREKITAMAKGWKQPVNDLAGKLAALDKAATQGEWEVDTDGLIVLTPEQRVTWSSDRPDNNRLAAALVNAYRADQLVVADGEQSQAATITALQAALKPFADAVDEWGNDEGQPDRWNTWEHPIAGLVTLGDFRKARATLAVLPIAMEHAVGVQERGDHLAKTGQ